METNPAVFDISTDEDEVASAFQESKGDDYNWFSEVLEAVNKGFDDSDDLVVVGEVNPKKKSKSWNSSVRKNVTEEDDDCIVLEGDPEKAPPFVDDPHEDSDDLIIVSQKGQVACRDFPHPRHDCAKFPFSSTSHQQHCELCHCFVCDMQAPCCHWGSGISKSDHCHATDKEEIWKTLRKNFRLGRNGSVPPATSHFTGVPQLNQAPRHDIIQLTTQNHVSWQTPPVTSHSTVVPQHNQAPRRDIIQLTQTHLSRPTPIQASGNCMPQNHVSRPSIIRACSSSTRYRIPHNPSIGSHHVVNKSTVHPRSVSQEVLGVHNTVIRRDRGSKIKNLGSQFVSSNTMSKRLDPEVPSTMNHTAYVPPLNIPPAHAPQYQQSPASVATSNERNLNPLGWPKNCPNNTSSRTYTHQSSPQLSVDCGLTIPAPSLSSANRQNFPQLNVQVDTYPVQNRNHPATSNGFSDFDMNWVNIGESNQQPSADNLQLQTPGATNGEGPFKVNEGDRSYYNELENFLFDNQCAPEGSLTAGLTAPSPPPDHIAYNTGMLFFDIESSWESLTRA